MNKQPHRIVWFFAAGYFLAYAPYCATIKLLTTGPSAPPGLVLMPAVIVGTVFSACVGLTLLGWWKFLAMPPMHVIVSGVGAAVIIATTTLAYTFGGVSIVLTLVLLRGGVLILAPLVDRFFRRTVRWFSWVALALSIGALAVALTDVKSYHLTVAAAVNIAAYLLGYIVRLPSMTHGAKQDDPAKTRRYFVQELIVALIVLAFAPVVAAIAGNTQVRDGWEVLTGGPLLVPALLIGAAYTVLYFFGTLIYLDKRENTFCIPLNRSSSLLAGVFVSMAGVGGVAFPSIAQLAAATMIILALMLLSPAHHIFEWRPVRHAGTVGEPQ